MNQANKRFLVALSFPGEYREFIKSVAHILSGDLGQQRVLYDKFHEAEFARPNLDTHLQALYHDDSELVVIFLCADYERKEWPGLEWRAIRDLIKKKNAESIMLIRFDDANVPGVFSIDGYVDAENRNPKDIAALIIDRLQIFQRERSLQEGPLREKPLLQEPSAPTLDSPETRGVFGRETKIREVTKELKNTGILTIYGMPGIGKSVLIDEVRKQNEIAFPGYAAYRLTKDDTLVQIYTQLAHALGCRDVNPMDKFELVRKFNYSPFQEFSKHAKPFLICFDKAQHLYSEGFLAGREIKEFLLAITRYYPKSRIILESQESPPADAFNQRVHRAIKIGGIDKESMSRYYRLPFRDRSDVGWSLDDVEAKFVFERLGGKRAQAGAHPLAMTLLAMVASELAETPSQVLDRPEHKEKYDLALETSLFDDLYEKVLTDTERHVLRLCALYREDLPDAHVDTLNTRAGGEGFAKLIRLCLITSKEKGDWYILHSVIKDLTLKRIDKSKHDFSSDHEAIADAWLAQLRISSHPSPPNIRMANAAFYHLSEGDCYRRLHELSERLLNKNIIPHLYDVQKQQRDKGNFEGAIGALKLILRLDGNEHKAHRFLAEHIEILYGRGHTEALDHFKTAYELDPTYGHYLTGLGRCLLARDDPAAFVAIVDNLDDATFDRTMSDDHNRALFATCLEKIGRGQEASKLRRARIDKGSHNAVFYTGEANYLNDQGDYQGALAILQMAENRGSINEYNLNIKAKVLAAMGKGSEASKLRQGLIDKGSRHAATYSDEAHYLLEKGDNAGALEILEKAESRGCATKYTFAIKTKVLAAMGREAEASRLRWEQIDKGSQDEIFYNDEAMYLNNQGDPEGALKILQKAESNACTNEYTFAIKAKVLATMGRENDASRLRREQIDKGVRNIAFYNDEAKYLKQQGDYVGALDVLRRAAEVGCADAYSIVTKAVVLEELGRGAEASTLRMEHIVKGIRDAAFYNDEAKYQKDQGKYEVALAVIQKSETAGCLDEYTLAIKAGVLAALGREFEAADIRREQIDKGSRNPAFYTDEAKYLSSQDNYEGAVEMLLIPEKRGFATEYTSALKASLLKSLGRKDSSTNAGL